MGRGKHFLTAQCAFFRLCGCCAAAIMAIQHGDHAMIDLKSIDDLARKLSEMLPPDLKNARADLQQHFRATLQSGLSKLALVTREASSEERRVGKECVSPCVSRCELYL